MHGTLVGDLHKSLALALLQGAIQMDPAAMSCAVIAGAASAGAGSAAMAPTRCRKALMAKMVGSASEAS